MLLMFSYDLKGWYSGQHMSSPEDSFDEIVAHLQDQPHQREYNPTVGELFDAWSDDTTSRVIYRPSGGSSVGEAIFRVTQRMGRYYDRELEAGNCYPLAEYRDDEDELN